MTSRDGSSNRGSVGVQEWAAKRKEQMERARLLREERKSGPSGGVLKASGQDFVHRQNSNGRSQQNTQMSSMNQHDASMLSSQSVTNYQGPNGGGRAFGGSSPSLGYQTGYNPNMQGPGVATPGVYSQQSRGSIGHPHQLHTDRLNEFMPTQYTTGQSQNMGGQASFYQQFANNQHGMQGGGFHNGGQTHYPAHLQSPPHPGQDPQYMRQNSLDNSTNQYMQGNISTRTAENYYNAPGNGMLQMQSQANYHMSPMTHQPRGTQHNTIGYDGTNPATPNSNIGYGYAEQLKTQDFSGFQNGQGYNIAGRTSRDASGGGGLTPGPQYRQTNYSQRDIEEARGSLTLLKKRMNSRERDQNDALSADGTRNHFGGNMNSSLNNNQRSIQNGIGAHSVQHLSQQKTPQQTGAVRLSGQFNHVPKPPRPNGGAAQIFEDSSVTEASQQSTGNRNYRKVFKPNLASQTLESNDQDSVDNINNMVLGGGINGGRSSHSMPHTQHQSPTYKPEKQSAQPRKLNRPPQHEPRVEPQDQVYADREERRQPPRNQNKIPPKKPQQRVPARIPQDLYNETPGQGAYNQDERDPFGQGAADPFGQKATKPRVANTPPKGVRQQPVAQPQMSEYPEPNAPQEYAAPSNRVECRYCGRKFNEEAIAKHEGICAKTINKKRKVFDSKAGRAATDATGQGLKQEDSFGGFGGGGGGFPGSKKKQPPPKKAAQARAQPADASGKPIPKWKLQSMQFRQATSNKPQQSSSGGGASNFNPTQEPSVDTDDRVSCQWCGRKFGEVQAERHIPVCEQKYKANLMKQGGKAKPPLKGRR